MLESVVTDNVNMFHYKIKYWLRKFEHVVLVALCSFIPVLLW